MNSTLNVSDVDGNVYKTVKIGVQLWMAENLNVGTFRNGDPIPEAETDEEWMRAGEEGKPAWCRYDNVPANGEKHGKLYNCYAVADPRGLAPEGWRIPSDEEWTQLIDYLGGEIIAGTKMKDTTGWAEDRNGTNESGFSAIPGGYRGNLGSYDGIGIGSSWWSSTEYRTGSAWRRTLGYLSSNVYRYYYSQRSGFSVRCFRD